MGDGTTTIPVWLQLAIFALPIIGLVVETTKYFINRADARAKKKEENPPTLPVVPPVQIVQGQDFSMDREVIAMLKHQIASKDSELDALRKQNTTYLRLLLMNDVAVPDDSPETMV